MSPGRTPVPREIMETTTATPIMMPSIVRKDRSFFDIKLKIEVLKLS